MNTIDVSDQASEWNISTDIYSIVDSLNKLKARYIDDVNETTLSLGIFGFIGDTEAKKIQSSIIMAGELGNEMFPARAKLNKNVLAHAIYCNIEGINAIPATLTVDIGVKESDLDKFNKVIDDAKIECVFDEERIAEDRQFSTDSAFQELLKSLDDQ